MKKANNDEVIGIVEFIADKLGYKLVKSNDPQYQSLAPAYPLLTQTEQVQLEAKSVEELGKELVKIEAEIDKIMRQINEKKNELQIFLNKNIQANKAVNTVAQGYGYTLPSNLVEVESPELPKLNQTSNFIRDQIFKKSIESLSEGYGKKIEYGQRGGMSKFVLKL